MNDTNERLARIETMLNKLMLMVAWILGGGLGLALRMLFID